jgi:hypothetical protein
MPMRARRSPSGRSAIAARSRREKARTCRLWCRIELPSSTPGIPEDERKHGSTLADCGEGRPARERSRDAMAAARGHGLLLALESLSSLCVVRCALSYVAYAWCASCCMAAVRRTVAVGLRKIHPLPGRLGRPCRVHKHIHRTAQPHSTPYCGTQPICLA